MQTRSGAAAAQDELTLAGDPLFEAAIAWGSLQSHTLPVECVQQGDVVAVAQRFYRVDSIVQTGDRFGFPLLVLRSLETGASAAIEFRADAPVSVLRFSALPQSSGEAAGRGQPNSASSPATRSAPATAEVPRKRRRPAGIFLKEAIE